MASDPTRPTTEIEEAAHIIARLIGCMDQWEREHLNSVAVGIAWLRRHNATELYLPDGVRRMMEAAQRTEAENGQ